MILVDGENFRYSLKHLFSNKFEYLPKKTDWFKIFNLPKLENQELIRIYWYVVDRLHFRPYELPHDDDKFEKLLKKVVLTKLELKRNLDNKAVYLKQKREELKSLRSSIRKRFDQWKKFQDSISRYCDYLEFRRSGSILFNLLTNRFEKEKGVDVKLATDLLAFRNISDQAILFSGDQDYIPAIQIYKDAGKQIFTVNFETENGYILPGGSYNLAAIVDKVITIKYGEIFKLIEEF